ncbi:NAD-dependent succinate-semialdehyde dehydrogenase [Plantactinospora soyae]|uniref:Succinate-semialdehyde dehydrogenase/glutarate-semialdehyde dehydrogenase n=1 Tax=Plantactinospora soyae TaxID=1544732 RepID=A0A927M5Q0_9ACTN|nr:NAD-dependent succinate-semialdehyde dehydrogenase [Plantactinospora soyae]MBE1488497.1 succinate-semialdehyde dehydrogenase/glutarate-semialdehyde dehydrogenase [Plantactinospora soyae]
MIDPTTLRTDLFVDGGWRPASGGRRLDVVDPSTGQPFASVADADPQDALAAVAAAASARPGWSARAPRERAEILRRCYELMIEREDELAALISLENGKALPDAHGEVRYAAEFFRWYAEEAVRVIGDVSVAPSGANRILVQYQPIGVAVLVTPWNFPAAMATRKIAPALAAGCAVVLKPAAETPLTAYAVAEILHEAGVPAGVVNVVTTGDPGPVVSAMLHDPRVRALSFTGSTPVGRLLLREAADQVLKCSMELGGNAPFIVFDDADLDDALDGVMIAKMRNGGQACTAANRIYVQDGLREKFVAGLAARMAALPVGPGTAPETLCGPLIDQRSVDKVDRLVTEAVAGGARVVLGGRPLDGPGYFYPPTVLDGVAAQARLAREEVFGPVAGVIPFTTDDEVVAAANDTEHGLAAYVYTRDLARGLAIADRLESGMVAINRGLVSDPAAPFGGVKQSGLGREGARDGLLEYTEAKYVALSW